MALIQMMNDLRNASSCEAGYARRKFTFTDTSMVVFVVNDEAVASLFEAAAKVAYDVESVVMPQDGN